MRRNSEAVKTDVGRPMSSPHRQRVARISEDLVIDVDHPLQMEEGLAIARRAGAGIGERRRAAGAVAASIIYIASGQRV